MKLTITTLTGDKFDVEVKAEDKVKDIKVSSNSLHGECCRVIQMIPTVRWLHEFSYFATPFYLYSKILEKKFHGVFGKNWQNHMLVAPSQGNPRSNHCICYSNAFTSIVIPSAGALSQKGIGIGIPDVGGGSKHVYFISHGIGHMLEVPL